MDGVCVVDHDSIKGAEEVDKLNKDENFLVVKGIEFTTEIGDLLGIFLKKEFKYDRKKGLEWLISEIHKQGGLAILAHPGVIVRKNKLDVKRVAELDLDAIEGYNARNVFAEENRRAVRLAKKLKKPITTCSDAHFWWEIGRNIVECDDLYTGIKTGKMRLVYKNPDTSVFSFINASLSKAKVILGKLLGRL